MLFPVHTHQPRTIFMRVDIIISAAALSLSFLTLHQPPPHATLDLLATSVSRSSHGEHVEIVFGIAWFGGADLLQYTEIGYRTPRSCQSSNTGSNTRSLAGKTPPHRLPLSWVTRGAAAIALAENVFTVLDSYATALQEGSIDLHERSLRVPSGTSLAACVIFNGI